MNLRAAVALHCPELSADAAAAGGIYAPGDALLHLDPVPTFHPPSLKNPRRVPADNPGETSNRFLDKKKRNSRGTRRFRDKLLRNQPRPQPPAAHTTVVAPHMGVFTPFQGF